MLLPCCRAAVLLLLRLQPTAQEVELREAGTHLEEMQAALRRMVAASEK